MRSPDDQHDTAAASDRLSEELQFWNRRFSESGYLYGTEPNAFLVLEAHRLTPGGRVLAVADGEGRNGVWLAEQGFAVHSIEGSPEAVAKARRLAADRGVRLARSPEDLSPGSMLAETVDVLTWAWPQKHYDAVVAIFIQFLQPHDRPRVFEAMAEALREGGVLLLEGYGRRQLEYRTGGPGSADLLYDKELLLHAFPSLETIVLREHDSEVQEGSLHAGLSALIDLIAVAKRSTGGVSQ